MNEVINFGLEAAQTGFQTGASFHILQGFVGTFFAVSGFHKLFNAAKHKQMVRAMEHAKIPHPIPMAWFVSFNEFIWGVALMTHLLVGVAATALFIVILVAWKSEVKGRIEKGAPYTGWAMFGKCSTVLCMAETFYAIALISILIG